MKRTYLIFKIQSIFSRVRLLYGATPIEDIVGYNQVVRSITEWTNTSGENTITQQSINEGIGGYTYGRSGSLSTTTNNSSQVAGTVNVRQAFIHGISLQCNGTISTNNVITGQGFGVVPNGNPANPIVIAVAANNADMITSTNPRKRYQVQLALGLFNQPKLIPTKFMASQLSIEITLANPSECMIANIAFGAGNPTYQVTNVNLIPEILEFDASYGIKQLT